jgi:hypothetical protein
MNRIQKYRNYAIRKIYEGGYSVMSPEGAHLKTVPCFHDAIVCIDMEIMLQRALTSEQCAV